MKSYKKLLSILIIFVVLIMSIGLTSAGSHYSSEQTMWIHTYGNGSAGLPAHWKSPNGIEFKDNAWILAFVAYYKVTFYDDSGNQLSHQSGSMTSGSKDRVIAIPD